jgi:phage terminase large subunit
VKFTYRDNPWFPEVLKAEMEHCKKTDPAAFDHIWEGMCISVIEGAIYAEELRKLELEQRITRVPYDPEKPVQTFWDIGDRYTAVWFAQSFPFEYRLIDYLEGEALSINHYMKQLRDKPYVYSTHWLPHDAQSPQLGTGKSIEEQMLAAGFPVRIVPKLSLASGISAARTVFGMCWFDGEKCADGLQALRHYRWQPEGTLGQIKREPLHDWASHPSDAFRYFAVGIQTPKSRVIRAEQMPANYGAWS